MPSFGFDVPLARDQHIHSAGLGTVYATTVVHRSGEEPYNVSLVDLDEGARVMSRVDGLAAGAVRIGLRVQAHAGDDGAPVFTAA